MIMNVLVLGATGYVGGRLIPRLLDAGHSVSCLVRDPEKAAARSWAQDVRILRGDVLEAGTLQDKFNDIEVVYYLVHSMGAGSEFVELDRKAAKNVARAVADSSSRLIYLGGLGHKDEELSEHLASRQEVGRLLRLSGRPVLELRAGIIVGSGSLSFEMIHHLVKRLPAMICPKWVSLKTQPIFIDDVISYLLEAADHHTVKSGSFDIGGPEILSYKDLMLLVAEELHVRRWLISVPLLTPRLSSYWINFVTPIQSRTARSLIESLKHETIASDQQSDRVFEVNKTRMREAVRVALGRYETVYHESDWRDASVPGRMISVDKSHFKIDSRTIEIDASLEDCFKTISSLGGQNGWLFADWLWTLRGLIDKLVGGVGMRRGRRHPTRIAVGDVLDCWRVEDVQQEKRLLLRAEMNVWGKAWLEYRLYPLQGNRFKLVQTATFYPANLFGDLYWFAVSPLHLYLFSGLIERIKLRIQEGSL
jgi:uncharacterized protein YbjT (DUF2867 family)